MKRDDSCASCPRLLVTAGEALGIAVLAGIRPSALCVGALGFCSARQVASPTLWGKRYCSIYLRFATSPIQVTVARNERRELLLNGDYTPPRLTSVFAHMCFRCPNDTK